MRSFACMCRYILNVVDGFSFVRLTVYYAILLSPLLAYSSLRSLLIALFTRYRPLVASLLALYASLCRAGLRISPNSATIAVVFVRARRVRAVLLFFLCCFGFCAHTHSSLPHRPCPLACSCVCVYASVFGEHRTQRKSSGHMLG